MGVPYLCFLAHSVLHAGQLGVGLHVSSCAQEEMKDMKPCYLEVSTHVEATMKSVGRVWHV